MDCPEVECNVGARPNIKAALDQAEEAKASSGASKMCVAVCKWDRQPATATMRLDDFVKVLSLAYGDKYNE